MNCLYQAFCDHLRWLGEHPGYTDHLAYSLLKWWTHGSNPQATFGGVAPWMLSRLAQRHRLGVIGQYRVYTPQHHLRIAEQLYPRYYKRHRAIIQATDFGYHCQSITLAPAIYFVLDTHHAVFADRPPEGHCVVAGYQLFKKGL